MIKFNAPPRREGRRVFQAANNVFFLAVALVCLLPYLHLIAKSFSGNFAVVAGKVGFWPVDFQLDVYGYVVRNGVFWQAFRNSVLITVLGTIASMAVTVLAAYPLSKPDFRGRRLILLLYVFSMLFYGGTIPIYILMQSLRLLNTLWAMIIPFLVTQFNLFVMKTFFEGIPPAIEESAKIDGAGQMRILLCIVLPLSLPSLATIALFYAVNYWNGFYHAMLFVNKQDVKPLQLYLYEMIGAAANTSELDPEAAMSISSGGVQAASIVLGTLPIVLLYPFAQKYFVHGLTIGSVKG
ncbi:ABC transporter permease subunit [Beduinella massiliensis]|uniref:ABC transporter permease subunit n=1 Tax=Beduinella massiliensis TaxID=1852363 RepID=UPI000C866B3E